MLIEIDENNYCTGNFDIATIDTMINYVYVEKLPEWYQDIVKFRATKCIKVPRDVTGDIPYYVCYELDNTRYDELLEQHNRTEYEAEAGKRIAELKEKLSETDYQVIKCAEYQIAGLDSPYDIKSLHDKRQQIRDEINKLEKMN